MKKSTAVAGVLASAALAVGGASAVALSAAPADAPATGALEAAAVDGAASFSPFVRVSNVQGTFSASQDVVTPLADITNRFSKAVAAMCAAMPNIDLTAFQGKIAVGGDVERPFEATVSQMAEEEGSASYVLACACASNIPGGGAIVNAQVEGVSLQSIAVAAGA